MSSLVVQFTPFTLFHSTSLYHCQPCTTAASYKLRVTFILRNIYALYQTNKYINTVISRRRCIQTYVVGDKAAVLSTFTHNDRVLRRSIHVRVDLL